MQTVFRFLSLFWKQCCVIICYERVWLRRSLRLIHNGWFGFRRRVSFRIRKKNKPTLYLYCKCSSAEYYNQENRRDRDCRILEIIQFERNYLIQLLHFKFNLAQIKLNLLNFKIKLLVIKFEHRKISSDRFRSNQLHKIYSI